MAMMMLMVRYWAAKRLAHMLYGISLSTYKAARYFVRKSKPAPTMSLADEAYRYAVTFIEKDGREIKS